METAKFLLNIELNPNQTAEKFLAKQSFAVPPPGGTAPETAYRFPFRCLSATIVAGGTYRATSFADEKVLKASVQKLLNKPVYKDHATYTVDNVVGLVESVEWQPSYTAPDGTVIPAGINGVFKIDAAIAPDTVRALLNEPAPMIQSCSVTVEFLQRLSHEEKDGENLRWKVGEYASDGRMITLNATEIIDYHEVSLVWMGADPFAKAIDKDGNLINVDKGAIVSFDKNGKPAPLYGTLDRVQQNALKAVYSLHKVGLSEPVRNPNDPETVALAKAQNDVLSLRKEVESLQKQIDGLKGAKSIFDDFKKEVLRMYNIATMGNTNPKMEKEIENETDFERLSIFAELYAAKMGEFFKPTCKSCGSNAVSYQSSAAQTSQPEPSNSLYSRQITEVKPLFK